ncbi:MAG: EAL domain-containing protein [Gammaproteobacteria bacterium]|nr:EAL domain-containing protein [Gammaproteobacteria bacterium]
MVVKRGVFKGEWAAFLSLKWKVLLVLSLVLLVINIAFSAISYKNLMSLFDRERQDSHKNHRHEISTLIQQSRNSLLQLGVFVPSLSGVNLQLLTENKKEFEDNFENHWSYLSLDMGLVAAEFFSTSGEISSAWGQDIYNEKLRGAILTLVEKTRNSELPNDFIRCGMECVHYSVVPMISSGEHVGELLLGRSLTEVIIQFSKITSSDIGIVSREFLAQTQRSKSPRIFHKLGIKVNGVTNKEHSLALLAELENQGISYEGLHHGVRFEWQEKTYEVSLIPIEQENQDQAQHHHQASHNHDCFLIIADVTQQINQINRWATESIHAGIVGLLLSELALLLVLWRPIRRIKVVSEKLPLLAQGEFQRVCKDLKSIQNRYFCDEIDHLSSTSQSLSNQLEFLTNEVEAREQNLKLHNKELIVERNFVKGILDTAEALILTQDSKGKVILCNSYAASLSGYNIEKIQSSYFLDLHDDDELRAPLKETLMKLVDGELNKSRGEGRIVCENGSLRHILWSFSKLEKQKSGQSMLSIGLDITEIKRVESRIAWLADHDPLTELFNRRRFQDELEGALAWSRRSEKSGALLYLDLDNFKDINDTGGHHSGDALLRSVSATLSKVTREVDIIGKGIMGRLGGDEFGIVFRDTDQAGIITVVERMRAEMKKIRHSVNGQVHSISTSIGVALFPQHGDSMEELMANADLAMYQAKSAERGSWHIFSADEQVREHLHERILWKERIEMAIKHERFVLYYQPILNIQSNTISHYEALIRMIGDEGEIIPPISFIPIAEQNGLISLIDRYVLERAIRQQVTLSDEGEEVTIAINLSGRAFEDSGLLAFIKKQIFDSGADPKRLIFEITETEAVADMASARVLMGALKKLGCQFALDDFGVGFASFTYLKELPVDYVKIDGSFIRDLPEKRDNQIFVKALSDVARGFGKKTVAEFVDSEETIRLLHLFHVDYAQGYYVGKPRPQIQEQSEVI